jgi:serine phosphatase RsbU (regulator of sigma subunit)
MITATRVDAAAASIPWDPSDAASGDWYDTLDLPNGDMGFVVGDAAGRGAQAAPVKEALQPALRQLAECGAGPGEILEHLRRIVGPVDDGLATVVYAVVAPDAGDVVLVSAGHPPPLLVHEDGSAQFLSEGVAPPLGAPCRESGAAVSHARLAPGDTLVLYTDGLIERPGRDIADGLRRLAASASGWARASVAEVCPALMRLGYAGGRPVDDLTALAVRFGSW